MPEDSLNQFGLTLKRGGKREEQPGMTSVFNNISPLLYTHLVDTHSIANDREIERARASHVR